MDRAWRGLAGLVLRRLISLFLVLILVLTVLFLFFRVGIGTDFYIPKAATPEYKEEVLENLHGDESVVVQYFYYLADMLTGGGSFQTISQVAHGQVGDAIRLAILPTIMLFGFAAIFSFLVGLIYQKFALGMKSRMARMFGSAFAFFLWTVPFVLVVVLLMSQFMFRLSWWPIMLPHDYNDMNVVEKTYAQLKLHAFPIIALLISTLGGFALMIRDGSSGQTSGEDSISKSRTVNRESISRVLARVMPNLKLNLAWIMSCVIIVEVLFSLNGLGRFAMVSIFAMDYALMEASIFAVIVILLLATFCTDLLVSIACARSSVDVPTVSATLPTPTSPDSASPTKNEPLAHRLSEEINWFVKAYIRCLPGLIGFVLFAAMGVMAIVGPMVAKGPSLGSLGWDPNSDPVSEFLRGSRGPFEYALAVTVLSFALGMSVGVLAVALGRFNYPIMLLAECFLVFPILAMLIVSFISVRSARNIFWLLTWSTVLITWAPVTLAVSRSGQAIRLKMASERQASRGIIRFKSTVMASLRETLPDALSAVKFVVVLGTLSILLFEYEFGGGWSGMISHTLQYGYWEEVSLWWILPATGYVVLLAGYYLMLQAVADISRKRFALSTPR